MQQLIVTANKLNKRSSIPSSLPDARGIIGIVVKGFTFTADEVTETPNGALGKWYKDRDNCFYWGGALSVIENQSNTNEDDGTSTANANLENTLITPVIKKKIEQVVNAFETGSAQGNYAELVKFKDYMDPDNNNALMVQITYGRSQTTEFGHLKALVQDYVNSNGTFTNILSPYLDRLGKKPSLATDSVFCKALIDAGKTDPIMKTCQDELFEVKYYQPAFNWFTVNGFTLPLSMLVIYDSTVHSGGILLFLRKRFSTAVPINGGNEKEWITNYVNVRNQWLATAANPLLHTTVYRTKCFITQIQNDNWDISQTIVANGVNVT